MDFAFTEEQEMWRKELNDFVEKEAGREYTRECDQEPRYPQKLWDAGVKQGFLGLMIPEEYGGMGSDALMYAIFCECLAKYSYEMASVFTLPMFCASNIVHNGTEEQKKRYLPAFVEGKIRFSISISEPEAGSDAASISTEARLDGDHFVLNGQKQFATGAHLPNNIIVMAVRTDKTATPRHNGISVLLIPNDLPGIELDRLPLIARRAIGTCSIFLNDVNVPRENLIGELNGGWEILTGHLEIERLSVAACMIGEAQQALNEAMTYAKDRVQFGRPISRFQEIGHWLAELQAELDAARLLSYRLGWMITQGIPAVKEAAMAKLVSTEMCQKITTAGMQILGGYSFMPEMDMERHWRTAKFQTIGGGTSQIQRSIIARQLEL